MGRSNYTQIIINRGNDVLQGWEVHLTRHRLLVRTGSGITLGTDWIVDAESRRITVRHARRQIDTAARVAEASLCAADRGICLHLAFGDEGGISFSEFDQDQIYRDPYVAKAIAKKAVKR